MREELLKIIEDETGHAVTEETLLDDLDTDSLEFVNLTLALSNASGKTFDDARLPELRTIGDLLREFE
jgi:acyl carrier protein